MELCSLCSVFGGRSLDMMGNAGTRKASLRIPAVIAAGQTGQAWRTPARNRLDFAGTVATWGGALMGLLIVAAIVAFGVVQVWRLQRSGLLTLGFLYLVTVSQQLLLLQKRRGDWFNVTFSVLMLVALLSPHAWRICRE